MKCIFANKLQPTLICFKRFQNFFEWFDENLRNHVAIKDVEFKINVIIIKICIEPRILESFRVN